MNANIAQLLTQTANRIPHQRAVVAPCGRDKKGRTRYTHLTFAELDTASGRVASGLNRMGITTGTRTVLMVPPGIDFFILTFALFKAGAIPVVVDPGMGLRRMVDCLSTTGATAFIGIPKAHLLRFAFPRAFATVTRSVTTASLPLPGSTSLATLLKTEGAPLAATNAAPDTTAAILFTTGSTGPAKGVTYTHANFQAQIAAIKEYFAIEEGDIDLPTFPLFALFDPALGMTAIIPEMDPTRPAKADPALLTNAIAHNGVTTMFCSPALLDRLGRYTEKQNLTLPTLKRVVSAGAPVAPEILERFAKAVKDPAILHTPYGATEAVPVAAISAAEILQETRTFTDQGMGICVGRPVGGADIRIIRITEEPIPHESHATELVAGEIGEIVVQADVATRSYFENDRANALAKIEDEEGFWHRMGDLAWKDNDGRIWFCGRKSHRVRTGEGTLFTIPCEAIFNTHSGVKRSALVGTGTPGQKVPVIVIEAKNKNASPEEKKMLRNELLELAGSFRHTAGIRTLLFHPDFPVDIRHNAKINREALSLWAERKMP